MYQSLIFWVDRGDDAGRLRAALNLKHLQGAADPLIDGMGRNAEERRNLFRREMLGNQAQTLKLARAKTQDPFGKLRLRGLITVCKLVHVHSFLPGHASCREAAD